MLTRALLSTTLAAALAAVAVPATAATPDSRGHFTFSEPVELPGATLGPGEYMFRTVDSGNRVVQVMSADGRQVYGMFHSLPAERFWSDDDTEISLSENASGQPRPIYAWWPAGRRTGYQFIYPHSRSPRLVIGDPAPVPAAAVRPSPDVLPSSPVQIGEVLMPPAQ